MGTGSYTVRATRTFVVRLLGFALLLALPFVACGKIEPERTTIFCHRDIRGEPCDPDANYYNKDDNPTCGLFPHVGSTISSRCNGQHDMCEAEGGELPEVDDTFQFKHLIGSGNFICDRIRDQNDYGWVWGRGPDFGAITDDGLMSMVMTVDDDLNSDGGVFLSRHVTGMTRKENTADYTSLQKRSFRSFRRDDGIPCQPNGVTIPQFFLTFGDMANVGQDFFVYLPYENHGADKPIDKPHGKAGIFFYDYDRMTLYPVVDDRFGLVDLTKFPDLIEYVPPEPDNYSDNYTEDGDIKIVEYPCQLRYPVGAANCAKDGKHCVVEEDGKKVIRYCQDLPADATVIYEFDDCRWLDFELVPGSDRVARSVYRGSFLDADGKAQMGIFEFLVEGGAPKERGERLNFVWRPLLDPTIETPASGPDPLQVPGQPEGVRFQRFFKSWINRRGVLVFSASYEQTKAVGKKALGGAGIYALHTKDPDNGSDTVFEGKTFLIVDDRSGGLQAHFGDEAVATGKKNALASFGDLLELPTPQKLPFETEVGEALKDGVLNTRTTLDLIINNCEGQKCPWRACRGGADDDYQNLAEPTDPGDPDTKQWGLGNIFFTSRYKRLGDAKVGNTRGLFVAMPHRYDDQGPQLSYVIHEVTRSDDEKKDLGIGFFTGPLSSFAYNDNNQLMFYVIGKQSEEGAMLFWDGSKMRYSTKESSLIKQPQYVDTKYFDIENFDLRSAKEEADGYEIKAQPMPIRIDEQACLHNGWEAQTSVTSLVAPIWFIISNYGMNYDKDYCTTEFLFRFGAVTRKPAGAGWAVWKGAYCRQGTKDGKSTELAPCLVEEYGNTDRGCDAKVGE